MRDQLPSRSFSTDKPLNLPPVIRQGLTDALRVELTTELVADDGYPPGAQDYFAEFILEYHLEAADPAEDHRAAAVREIARQLGLPDVDETSDEPVTFRVGHAQALVVDCVNGSVDALDARSGEDARLGQVLFTGGPDGDGLQSELVAFDDYALLLRFVTIEPPFRGHGLSLTAVDLMLDELSRGCMCALLDPMLPGARGGRARATARKGLSRHWAKLGFVDYADTGLMLLDFQGERPQLVRSR